MKRVVERTGVSIKHKVLNAIAAHPKLVTFGITFGIIMIVTMATVGGIQSQHAYAGVHIPVRGSCC